jgi:hypothetical protein
VAVVLAVSHKNQVLFGRDDPRTPSATFYLAIALHLIGEYGDAGGLGTS